MTKNINKLYLPMLFHTIFAVRVDNRHVAEQLVLEHFQKYNVRHEFDASARQKMSPEFAKVASMVGVECFMIDPEAAKTILLLIGEEVAVACGEHEVYGAAELLIS